MYSPALATGQPAYRTDIEQLCNERIWLSDILSVVSLAVCCEDTEFHVVRFYITYDPAPSNRNSVSKVKLQLQTCKLAPAVM